jgi:urease accessory protein
MVEMFPKLDLLIFESGGDNLASTFSLDLVDAWIFVIDVAGGDDIPRKRGPGLLQCDLLIVNKTDLAPYVGVNLKQMLLDATEIRKGRPVIAINSRTGENVELVLNHITSNLLFRDSDSGSTARIA